MLRSYEFCVTPPKNSKNNLLKSYVPIRSEQPSRSSRLICYVPMRSDYVPSRSTNELEKSYVFHTFLSVPCNSIANAYRWTKTTTTGSTVSQKKCRGVKCTHPIGTHRAKKGGPCTKIILPIGTHRAPKEGPYTKIILSVGTPRVKKEDPTQK